MSEVERNGSRAPGRSERACRELRSTSSAFEALREWRNQRARDLGVPPYVIIADRTIESLLEVRPTTRQDLLDVVGIGDVKLRKFCAGILAVVQGLPRLCLAWVCDACCGGARSRGEGFVR
ncbi:MAG: HRDC domain-containing protein [Deltaproteobacteria bacterium]|nr:HRDC domain-containing protein [Deltaproteobacteria bacterium]